MARGWLPPAVTAPGDRPDTDPHAAVLARILDDPTLVEPGFRPLATERETDVGPVDLYGTDPDGRHVVVEVKTVRAGPDAVSQLSRYVEALARDLHADATVRGVLVAPSITDRARDMATRRDLGLVSLRPAAGGRGR